MSIYSIMKFSIYHHLFNSGEIQREFEPNTHNQFNFNRSGFEFGEIKPSDCHQTKMI